MIIVTLSVVCTLKGTCQYTVQRIKAMYVCVKMMSKGSKEALIVLIVTHVTQIENQNLTQHLMQTCENCIKWPLAPARREGYCEPSILGV